MATHENPPSSRDAAWLLRDKYSGVECDAYRADLDRIAVGEPLAYVIGWVPFLGLRINLDSRPLIPRPETEWWTERLLVALRERFGDTPFTLLDLCAGSGAIGCAVLSQFPNAEVTFIDIDPAHADSIRETLSDNDLSSKRAVILSGDLFSPLEGQRFDYIVSNPPYIPSGRTLPDDVSQFEPSIALRAGTDGLDVIRTIASDVEAHLSPHGQIWLEVDLSHANDAAALFTKTGFQTEICTDLYGRDRLVIASSYLVHSEA